MNTIVDRFEKIKLNIASAKSNKPVNIIAVSKTFTLEHIKPLINHGQTTLVKIKFKKHWQNGQIKKKTIII